MANTKTKKTAYSDYGYYRLKDTGGSFQCIAQGKGCSGAKPAHLKKTKRVLAFKQSGGLIEIPKTEFDNLMSLFDANNVNIMAQRAKSKTATAPISANMEKTIKAEDKKQEGKRQLKSEESVIWNAACELEILFSETGKGWFIGETSLGDKWNANKQFDTPEFVEELKNSVYTAAMAAAEATEDEEEKKVAYAQALVGKPEDPEATAKLAGEEFNPAPE